MDTAAAVVTVIVAIAVEASALLALWFRLRVRAMRDRQDADVTHHALTALPPGACLELAERRGEGRLLQLRIISASTIREDASE